MEELGIFNANLQDPDLARGGLKMQTIDSRFRAGGVREIYFSELRQITGQS